MWREETLSDIRNDAITGVNVVAAHWWVSFILVSLALPGSLYGQVKLTADFPGANLGGWQRVGASEFELSIRKDSGAEFYRWYSFKVYGCGACRLVFHITNAAGANAARAWSYSRPAASGDGGNTWERIQNANYDDGTFSFEATSASDTLWIAYNPVYDYSRWLALIAGATHHPSVARAEVIAQTIERRPVHLIEITRLPADAAERPAIWIIARQHPAEVGGSWLLEGLLEFLLSDDATARALLRKTVFLVVGFMNPDGVVRGNYRVNSRGQDLAGSWINPDSSRVPSVTAVEKSMLNYGKGGGRNALLIDLHSNSTVRANFAYYHGAGVTTPEMLAVVESLLEELERENGDFSFARSLPHGAASGRTAAGWAYRLFGAHGITIETSYQDTMHGPYEGQYVTTQRLKALGVSLGRALAQSYSEICGVP